MKALILDIDNTIIIHNGEMIDYYNKKNYSRLLNIITSINFDKVYIYTNGTYGHGIGVINNLGLNNIVDKVFGRDTIPYMKPFAQSFKYVNNEIDKNINEVFFADDMVENLESAKKIGWITIWISPDFLNKEKWIDYAFPNIYDAMTFFKLKK
tara:strand:+ start:7266 stop:7724 length:459 start_codon:yes stop_codon:yes gene_type:complete